MGKKTLTVLGMVVAVLLLAIGGAYYYLSQKISPDDLRKLSIEQLQKLFPNAKIELGTIEFHLGTSIKFQLDRLEMELAKEKKALIKVENVRVAVPVWAILFGGGNIEIAVARPQISFLQMGKANNWTLAMGEKGARPEQPEQKAAASAPIPTVGVAGDGKIHLAIPALLLKSKISVRLTDILLQYQLQEQAAGSIEVSKFLVKNLNLESSTAFEVASTINVGQGASKMSLEALLIGEVGLHELVKGGDLTTLMVLELKKLELPGLLHNFPDIKTDIRLLMKNGSGELEGQIKTLIKANSKLQFAFKVAPENIHISDLGGEMFLNEFTDLIALPPMLKISKSTALSLQGTFGLVKNKLVPNLEIKLAPAIVVEQAGVKMEVDAFGKISNDRLDFKTNFGLLKGSGFLQVQTILPLDLAKMTPAFFNRINMDFNFSNITLEKQFIQGFLYPNTPKGQTAAPVSTVTPTPVAAVAEKDQSPVLLPNVVLAIDFANIRIDNQIFTAKGKVVTDGNIVRTEKLDFSYADGKGDLHHQTTLVNKSNLQNTFALSLSKFQLEGLRPFLPPMVDNLKGIFSGQVGGNANLRGEKLTYNVNVNLVAQKGEIVGINIGSMIKEWVNSIPALKGKIEDKELEIDGNFTELLFKGQLKDDHYDLSKIYFQGINNKIEINGNGNVDPSGNQNGSVLLEIKSPVLDRPLKEVAATSLPMMLQGKGFLLMADYQYTIKKLGQSYLQTKGKQEALKQVEKVTTKAVEKILEKDVGKKVDQMLGGKTKDKLKEVFKGFKR